MCSTTLTASKSIVQRNRVITYKQGSNMCQSKDTGTLLFLLEVR